METRNPHPLSRRLLTCVLPPLAAAVLVACGEGGAEPAPQATTSASATTLPAHVHGLGVDPADGALRIATHNGLFTALDGGGYEQVGERRDDFMGFSVTGPGSYIASGHPSQPGSGSPHLGLIRSATEGQDWEQVSLAGEADFHALRGSGRFVYGFNGLTGELLRSTDRGASWRPTTQVGPVIDLAIDPRDPQRVLASTEEGVQSSKDGGRSWERVERRPGLLAFSGEEVILFDAAGGVRRGKPDGELEQVGRLPEVPAAVTAGGSDDTLYAALADGRLLSSTDGGSSWGE